MTNTERATPAVDRGQAHRFTIAIFAVSLGCTIVATFVSLMRSDPLWASLLLGLVLVLAGGTAFARWAHRRGRPVGLLLIFAVLNLTLLAPELGLRLARFSYSSGIQFGHPNPTQFATFVQDSSLFWKFRPDQPGVNSWGFDAPEVVTPKPRGVFRILYLGDSCTWQSYQGMAGQSFSYPSVATTLLNASGRRRFEHVTLATPGYSSHQGRIVAERHTRAVGADVTVVFFGWNDHWRASGSTDARKLIADPPDTTASRLLSKVYANSRLLQALAFAGRSRNAEQPLSDVRVPIDDYRSNLLAIRTAVGDSLIFVTAPTAMYPLGVPPYLLEERFVGSPAEAIENHKRYNEVVREVSATTGAKLLDLEAEFNAMDNEALRALFLEDLIHFSPSGMVFTAHRVADFIGSHFPELPKQQ